MTGWHQSHHTSMQTWPIRTCIQIESKVPTSLPSAVITEMVLCNTALSSWSSTHYLAPSSSGLDSHYQMHDPVTWTGPGAWKAVATAAMLFISDWLSGPASTARLIEIPDVTSWQVNVVCIPWLNAATWYNRIKDTCKEIKDIIKVKITDRWLVVDISTMTHQSINKRTR